ncbi:TPA: hypothetical protein GRI54_20910 [Vibrio parahaemolyticus]|nr:hypothetical protein [Vibrio parahaemolyticus]EXJ42944.1 hypothetical protein D049_2974 [Vibrio parahaemolyticus VPTS-2010]EGQ8939740.1 hypothetical protein [Vibrio parahaemolyticus]EGQ8949344.1 hypothetical protein [Vibrio parahaemolyticus]EGQ8969927.1 hypothetical protein [Vibrio parahaemolyticus]
MSVFLYLKFVKSRIQDKKKAGTASFCYLEQLKSASYLPLPKQHR